MNTNKEVSFMLALLPTLATGQAALAAEAQLSVGAAQVSEGNSGTANLNFSVTRAAIPAAIC